VFTLPRMAAIQIVSARIGCVTRKGPAASIKQAYPRWALLAVVGPAAGGQHAERGRRQGRHGRGAATAMFFTS